MKTIVDNFSVLSIEKCLLQKLPDMLTPEIVLGLDDEQIESIAAESAESRAERTQAVEKLKVLEGTLKVLQSLDRHKSTDESCQVHPQSNTPINVRIKAEQEAGLSSDKDNSGDAPSTEAED